MLHPLEVFTSWTRRIGQPWRKRGAIARPPQGTDAGRAPVAPADGPALRIPMAYSGTMNTALTTLLSRARLFQTGWAAA